MHGYHITSVEVRELLSRGRFSLNTVGFWGSNSGCQVWWQETFYLLRYPLALFVLFLFLRKGLTL